MADEPIWLRLRQYVDGADSLDIVLAQLLDVALELEQLAQAGYVLDRPVEADGLGLRRVAAAVPHSCPNVRNRPHGAMREHDRESCAGRGGKRSSVLAVVRARFRRRALRRQRSHVRIMPGALRAHVAGLLPRSPCPDGLRQRRKLGP
jgi:hypothetical protein